VITRRQLDEICAVKRRKMTSRLKEKLWKSGKRAGMVRVPGRTLPFSLAEFRSWAMRKIGLGTIRCHYCPRSIDVLSFEPDHYVPVALGGSFGLDNLVPSCTDCNNVKDAMPPDDFIALMTFLETLTPAGRANVMKRLRAGSMGIRKGFIPPNAKAQQLPAPVPATKEMDFF
jgi:hypothetical protein